jgi:hypothetical protein
MKTLANSILSFYFPIFNGWLMTPGQSRSNRPAESIFLRLQRRSAGDRGISDHVVAEVKRKADSVEVVIQQLENTLAYSETESGRYWVIIFDGLHILFYEYHGSHPRNHRLVPIGPPSQPGRNEFHVRTDSLVVDEMFGYLLQRESLSPC